MPPTRAQLAGWQPWLLVSAADAGDDIVERLETQMTQLHSRIDHLDFSGSWTGQAQRSAFERIGAEKDFVRKIASIAEQLAEASRKCADELTWARERVLTLVGAAEADGFTVDEDWTVGLQPTVVSAGESSNLESAAAVWQEKITNAVADLDDSDRRFERTAIDRTTDLPTGGDVEGGATPPPGIPGPPLPPPTEVKSWEVVYDIVA